MAQREMNPQLLRVGFPAPQSIWSYAQNEGVHIACF